MSLQQNQFSLTPLKGAVAFKINPMTIPVMIDPNSGVTLHPGDYVVMTDTSGPVIYVDQCGLTDNPLGVIPFTPKSSAFVAGDPVEICLVGSILWGESAAAITRGDQLEFVPTGTLLRTNTGNPVGGIALDNASGANKLFRYMFLNPFEIPATITSGSINGVAIGGSTPAAGTFTTLHATGAVTFDSTVVGPGGGGNVYNLRTRVTTAQMNSGHDLLPLVTGRKYRLIDCKIIAIGANAAATANATGVAIIGTQGASPVNLVEVNLAELLRSAINSPDTASVLVLADGASFVDNDVSTKISTKAVAGTDLITVTNFDIDITYAID